MGLCLRETAVLWRKGEGCGVPPALPPACCLACDNSLHPLGLSFLTCWMLFLPKSMVSVRLGSVTDKPQIPTAQTTEVRVLLSLCPSQPGRRQSSLPWLVGPGRMKQPPSCRSWSESRRKRSCTSKQGTSTGEGSVTLPGNYLFIF